MKTLIRKDDKAIVVAGKEKGKTGKVVHVYPKIGKLMISGINMAKRHVRPTRDLPQGGVVEKEAPLPISNVMIYCSKCNKGVKVGVKKLPDNTKMRFCKKCEIEL